MSGCWNNSSGALTDVRTIITQGDGVVYLSGIAAVDTGDIKEPYGPNYNWCSFNTEQILGCVASDVRKKFYEAFPGTAYNADGDTKQFSSAMSGECLAGDIGYNITWTLTKE